MRLAIADSLSSEVIRRIFPELHRKYPDITLECISAGTQEMFRLLNQNEADIVYTLDNHIYDTNYVIQQESRIGVHFVCAAGNALAARDAISLVELVKQPFLLTEKGMSYRRMLERVYPFIGAIQLNRLRPIALENMLVELRKRKYRGKPIGEATVQKYLTVVSAVLTDAKRNEIIQKNRPG